MPIPKQTEKFQHQTAKDIVFSAVLDWIVTGVLTPGEKIIDTELADYFSVSRTPVREALIQLTCDGILENVPRKGYVLKGLTLEDISNIYYVIGSLDSIAAVLALPNLTEKDYKDLEFYIGSMDIALSTEYFEKYNKNQNEFHDTYINKCGNDVLIDEIHRLKNKLIKYPYSSSNTAEMLAAYKQSNDEHRHILKLMKEGKTEELTDYIVNVHWSLENAKYDLFKE